MSAEKMKNLETAICVIEIYGPESGGKTTLTLQIIAEAQKLGGQAAFIDAEHALDPSYARKLGVDVDNLLVSQPDHGEQALEIAQELIRSNAVDIIVIDSVAALVPKAELEGDMGDPSMGLQARLMSQALRKLTAIVSKSKTCLIFINQIREKIGVMFGNPETTTGGRALKFYASMRVDIRRIQAIKEGDRVVGSRTRAKIVKNKVAAPFREAEFDILYGEGISREGDLIDLGVDKGVLEKAGTWISYAGERMGQGRENARTFLKENADIRDKLENALRKKMEIPGPNSNAAPSAANGANGTNGAMQTDKPAAHAAAASASQARKFALTAKGKGAPAIAGAPLFFTLPALRQRIRNRRFQLYAQWNIAVNRSHAKPREEIPIGCRLGRIGKHAEAERMCARHECRAAARL